MVGIVYANTVFFYAGGVIVSSPYHCMQMNWVVLALAAHSHEGALMVRTSEEQRANLELILELCSIDWIDSRYALINNYHSNMSIIQLAARNTSTGRLKRPWGIFPIGNLVLDNFCRRQLGIMDTLSSEFSVHLTTTIPQDNLLQIGRAHV